jgi:hypothetical protein
VKSLLDDVKLFKSYKDKKMKTFSSYKDKLNNIIYLCCRNSISETTDVAKSQVDIM